MNHDPFAPTRWSVSDVTRYIRQMFDTDYRLQDLEVEGEVSNLKVQSASGHAYFTLKDAKSELSGVMWKSDVLAHGGPLPGNGERVIARGQIRVYEARGSYQLYCKTIRPVGLGDLHVEFEALKAKLNKEGLFAEERKRPIPDRPGKIGIVTGPETAALQDVLNILRRRYPLAQVILCPTPVQGDHAPSRIVGALERINRSDCDVILLVRGGGSIEDLWCFNDERVVRAIAASRIPIVSGVGHEIDFTLADFAADLRAPTPTAAAELVTATTVDDLRDAVERAQDRLIDAFEMSLVDRRRQINDERQRVDERLTRMGRALKGQISLRRARLNGLAKTLAAMNPDATLARGYAIVRGADGKVLRRAADVQPGDRLDIRLHEGTLKTRVDPDNS